MTSHRPSSLIARRMGEDLLVICRRPASGDTDMYNARALQLIDDGANVEAADEGGTCLIWAAFHGHADIVAALLAAGANINARDNTGGTALTATVLHARTGCATLLIAAKADPDAHDDNGQTALILAAIRGRSAIAAALLAAGASTGIKDSQNRTAADWADLTGHPDIADAIRAEEKRRHNETDAQNAFNNAAKSGFPTAEPLSGQEKIRIKPRHGKPHP